MKPQREWSSVNSSVENQEYFDGQFWRYKGLLRQIAERVLSGDENVEKAMQRSYAATADQRRRFKSDGEFRRWLVRTVLNEALVILHDKETVAEESSELIFWQLC